MSAETPTAAEVIADHIWCAATRLGSQLGVAEMTCGAPLPPAGRDFHAAHVHERLTAAGLLVTAEHDAQVAAEALREFSQRCYGEDNDISHAGPGWRDYGRGWADAGAAAAQEADRIAAGGES